MNYKKLNFTSKESWTEWYTTGVTPSDAPTIMGENPWMSREQLLQEKLSGIEKQPNDKMKRAAELKPLARETYNKISGEKTKSTNIESNAYPWMKAMTSISPNGYHIVEIKTGEFAFSKVKKTGKIPHFYFGEAQHILAVSGLNHLTYFFQNPTNPEESITLKCFPSEAYIKKLISSEEAFLTELQQVAEGKKNAMHLTLEALRGGTRVPKELYHQHVPLLISKSGKLTPLAEMQLGKIHRYSSLT
jgi:putative phage-type endonuclease